MQLWNNQVEENEGPALCQISDKFQADIFLLSVMNFTLLVAVSEG